MRRKWLMSSLLPLNEPSTTTYHFTVPFIVKSSVPASPLFAYSYPNKYSIIMAKKRGNSSKNSSKPKRAREDSPVSDYYVQCREPKYTLDDLVGLDDIKAELNHSVILPFLASKPLAEEFQLEAPKGILLTGAPGTGKSVLAEALVSELIKHKTFRRPVTFLKETGQCMSKWFGETEANLRSLFVKARSKAPCVIFFDEIDGIARQRDGGINSSTAPSLLTTLLEEMNNVEPGQVLVIAATNCSDLVDKALLRTGRFDVKLNIPIPDAPSRRKILEHYIAKKKYAIKKPELDRMVTETNGWTGSDIESFVKSVHLQIIDRLFPSMRLLTAPLKDSKKKMEENRCLTLNDLLPKLQKMRNSKR